MGCNDKCGFNIVGNAICVEAGDGEKVSGRVDQADNGELAMLEQKQVYKTNKGNHYGNL